MEVENQTRPRSPTQSPLPGSGQTAAQPAERLPPPLQTPNIDIPSASLGQGSYAVHPQLQNVTRDAEGKIDQSIWGAGFETRFRIPRDEWPTGAVEYEWRPDRINGKFFPIFKDATGEPINREHERISRLVGNGAEAEGPSSFFQGGTSLAGRERDRVIGDEDVIFRRRYRFWIGQGLPAHQAEIRAREEARQELGQQARGARIEERPDTSDLGPDNVPRGVNPKIEFVKIMAGGVTGENLDGIRNHMDIMHTAPKATLLVDRLFNKYIGGVNTPGVEVPENELIQHLASGEDVAQGRITTQEAKRALDMIATSIADRRLPRVLSRELKQTADARGGIYVYKFYPDALQQRSPAAQRDTARERQLDQQYSVQRRWDNPNRPSPDAMISILPEVEEDYHGKIRALTQVSQHGHVPPDALESTKSAFVRLANNYAQALTYLDRIGDDENYEQYYNKRKRIIRQMPDLNSMLSAAGLEPINQDELE